MRIVGSATEEPVKKKKTTKKKKPKEPLQYL